LEQVTPDSVSDFITLRDGHCRNHGRLPARDPIFQAEALVRALRDAGNNAVGYFITTAGHSSFEPETDARLRTIINELPPMTSSETAALQLAR
jgi:hypothetical protein